VLKIKENSNKYKYAADDLHYNDLQVKLGNYYKLSCHAEHSEASILKADVNRAHGIECR
jgi:hypothetical protein